MTARAELEKARRDLARSKEAVDTLIHSTAESEWVSALKTQVDESFELEYFTASYEVVQTLLADSNILWVIRWDWDHILAKAAQFSDDDPAPANPAIIQDPPSHPEIDPPVVV
ncbi:hypothetical protein LWI28_025968 [Acer negundo]|uniref:Uncharacterized protein n=1 Tax=Acer negundo TaxID=4023 RepID=A0AAD5JAY4_ACENE|nr:hypothetical protein LWI28_025968 [Acer negundo]